VLVLVLEDLHWSENGYAMAQSTTIPSCMPT
jgi:hypothetical protein